MHKIFPVIDLVATGENIQRLRKARGLSVRDLQSWFGFEEPQAIYKWQKGKSLPTVDNLYALGALLNVPMEEILVPCKTQLHIASGQQELSCCPPLFYRGVVYITSMQIPWKTLVFRIIFSGYPKDNRWRQTQIVVRLSAGH